MKTFAMLIALAFPLFSMSCSAQKSESPSNKPTQVTLTNSAVPQALPLVNVKENTNPDMMRDFSWKDGDKTVWLSEYAKGKVIFLNFWATWCGPCRREIPDIIELTKELGDKVAVIGVSFDQGAEGPQKVKDYVSKSGINYINIMGNGEINSAYGGISGIPTTFVINKDGKIVAKMVGAGSKADFLESIKKAM